TRTYLTGGRWLIAGGMAAAAPTSVLAIFDEETQKATTIPARLSEPRAWHTATMMADGSVLIVGGRGADGGFVDAGERFDPAPETVQRIENVNGIARAGHTATLLTDGRVVIVGGEARGTRTPPVEVWNLQTRAAIKVPDQVSRTGHAA